MNTTIESMKEYIFKNYGIDFELVRFKENLSERWLEYKNKKEKYTLSCGYAMHPEKNEFQKLMESCEYWSIYYDYMDYKEWCGYGGTYIDNGSDTIDKIMNMWGFQKKVQLSLFD